MFSGWVKSKLSIIALAATVSLSSCGYQLVDDGSGFLKTSSGELVAWPTGETIIFETDSSVPNELREHIAKGEEDINSTINRVQISVRLQSSQAPRIKKSKNDVIGDGVNGIYFLPEPWPWAKEKGKENTDAMTVLINKGTKIVEADIFYRISSFSAKYAIPESSQTEFTINENPELALNQFALTTESTETNQVTRDEKWTKVAFIHECLHALGFTHVLNETDSIMYPSISTSLYNNPFSTRDLLRLDRLY